NLCCSLEQQNNRLTIKLFIFWRNTQVWLKGSVLKTERGVKARGGSNPSSSFQKENLKEIKSLRYFSCFMIKNVLLFPFMVESIDNNKLCEFINHFLCDLIILIEGFLDGRSNLSK